MSDTATNQTDPIMVLDRIRNMAYDIIDEVWDVIRIAAIENPIKNKQEKIEILKWNFPIDYKKAKSDEEKTKLRKAIDTLNEEIVSLKKHQDKTEMSFLYIKQGIQNVFNGVMVLYAPAAEKMPSLQMKGDGSFVLSSSSFNNVYSTKVKEVGTPSLAVAEALAKAEFGVKALTKATKRGKDFAGLVSDGIQISDKAKEAKAAKKEKEQEEKIKAEEKKKEEAERKALEEQLAAEEKAVKEREEGSQNGS